MKEYTNIKTDDFCCIGAFRNSSDQKSTGHDTM